MNADDFVTSARRPTRRGGELDLINLAADRLEEYSNEAQGSEMRYELGTQNLIRDLRQIARR